MHETDSLQLRDRRAGLLRSAALFLGGIAGFLAVGEAAFDALIDSLLGSGTSDDAHTLVFGAIGLVGVAFAKRRPLLCAGCEIVAGVGLLADHHPILGAPMLAGAVLAAVTIRTPRPGESTGRTVRADLACAITALGVLGLALVAGGALFFLGLLTLAVALSGGSASGVPGTLVLILGGCVAVALSLLVRRARR
jgi:hypothetical protein